MNTHSHSTQRTIEQLRRGVVPWHVPTPKPRALPRLAAETLLASIPNLTARCPAEVSDYDPVLDVVYLPDRSALPAARWTVGPLHNLVHAAFHPDRLNSPALTLCFPFGVSALTAELGASYLCGVVGVTPKEPSTKAYRQGWIDALRRDPQLLPQAVEYAGWGTAYILRCAGV